MFASCQSASRVVALGCVLQSICLGCKGCEAVLFSAPVVVVASGELVARTKGTAVAAVLGCVRDAYWCATPANTARLASTKSVRYMRAALW